MAVNYDVWGSPETWIPAGAEEGALCEMKMGAMNQRQMYYQLWNNGYLNYDTIDQPYYWGMPKNALFAKRYYLAPYESDGVTQVASFPIADIDETTIPVNFYSVGRIPYTYLRYNYRYAPLGAIPTQSFYNENVVCLSFNYQKILVIPYVAYVSDDYASTVSVDTLYGYIENARYNTKNRIISIGYKVALGDGNTNRTTTVRMAAFMNYEKIKHYDVTYNGIPFAFRTDAKYVLCTVDDFSNSSEAVRAAYFAPLYRQTETVNYTVGDSQTALAYRYCKSDPTTSIPFYCYDPDSDLWKVNTSYTVNGTKYWYAYPYIEVTADNAAAVRDYILTQIAYLGLPFIYDPSLASRGKIGDTGVYLPVFDEAGVTTGEYLDGEDSLSLDNAEWIDGRTGAGYDPAHPVPSGDLDNVTGRNLNFWSSNKYYLMRQEDLDEFLARVNGLYTGGSTAEEKAEELRRMQVDFKGSNPSDYIVGLYGLPFQWVWSKQFFQPVMLGPVEVLPNDSGSSTAVELVNPDSNAEMLFGEIQIPELGNFLDYEPYTTLMLYVPFCGTCKLDTAEYIGHTVRVVGTLDKHTGELAVRIMRDGLTVTNTMTGNLYVSIPITAQAMGTYETNLHQLQMAAFNREFGLLTGAVTGGVSMGAAAAAGGEGEGGGGGMISPTAPISMAANLIQLPIAMADYEFRITHCQPPVFYSSSASSANQAKFYRKAKLFIKRPVFLDTYNTDIGKYVYAHTVGHACCKQVEHISDMISADHNHFIKCSNVCLTGIPATVEEINAIKQALCSGVYV